MSLLALFAILKTVIATQTMHPMTKYCNVNVPVRHGLYMQFTRPFLSLVEVVGLARLDSIVHNTSIGKAWEQGAYIFCYNITVHANFVDLNTDEVFHFYTRNTIN